MYLHLECLLTSLPIIVGRKISRAPLTRRTDTSYATATAEMAAKILAESVPLRQQRPRPVLRPLPRDEPSDSSVRRPSVDATEPPDAIRTRRSASRSTRVTRWATHRSRSDCRRRALALEDSEVPPAVRRRPYANFTGSPRTKICTSGTRCPAPSSTARTTKSSTNNSIVKLHFLSI